MLEWKVTPVAHFNNPPLSSIKTRSIRRQELRYRLDVLRRMDTTDQSLVIDLARVRLLNLREQEYHSYYVYNILEKERNQ